MVEGGGSKTFQKAKTWIFKYPQQSKDLLLRIANVCVNFLVGQVRAGAQLLQVFDSWAGELSPHDFEEFSFPTLQHIFINVRRRLQEEGLPATPMTLFAKGANQSLKLMATSGGYDVLGLDWCIEPSEARRIVGDKIALQGNMDPNLLYAGKEAIENAVIKMCKEFREVKGGWIANLGHGITPGVDPDDLKWFLECIHRYSASSTTSA
jgi:uroporphyrinogen decarboxylase